MHINRDLLIALFRGQITPEELLRLAQEHLLDRCRACRNEFGAFLEILKEVEDPEETALLSFDRRRELVESEEFKGAEAAARGWQQLLARLPEEQQLAKVKRARTRFRGAAFGYLLLEEARAAMPGNPRQALHLAEIVEIATYLEENYREIYVLAVAYQANAHRVLGNVDEASRRFKDLQVCAHLVTDTRTVAEVASFEGSMAFDHRLFDDAEARFTRATSLYHLVGDTDGEVRNLLKLGSNAYYSGRLSRAITLTREALNLVTDAESALYLGARHNLGIYLAAKGDGAEVAEMLCEDIALYRKMAVAEPQWNSLFLWLSGKVAAVLGNAEQAEALFCQTRGIFERQGNDYDAALVGLDLLRLYTGTARFAEMLALMDSMLPVFARYELAPETTELLSTLEVAVRCQRLGEYLLHRVALHLEHARRHTRV